MDFDGIARKLETTLEDLRLSRSESRALRDVFADLAFSESERSGVRNLAFDIAAGTVSDGPTRQTIDWLREVIKALDSATRTAAAQGPSVAAFSPGDDCRNTICERLREARRTADICVFTITDDRIVREIFATHDRGVRTRIISDDDKAGDLGSDIERLARHGIPVAVDNGGHMHHKFAVFDSLMLLGGSYNWTRSASSENHENVLVTEEPALVASFEAEFESLWNRYPRLVISS